MSYPVCGEEVGWIHTKERILKKQGKKKKNFKRKKHEKSRYHLQVNFFQVDTCNVNIGVNCHGSKKAGKRDRKREKNYTWQVMCKNKHDWFSS